MDKYKLKTEQELYNEAIRFLNKSHITEYDSIKVFCGSGSFPIFRNAFDSMLVKTKALTTGFPIGLRDYENEVDYWLYEPYTTQITITKEVELDKDINNLGIYTYIILYQGKVKKKDAVLKPLNTIEKVIKYLKSLC